jgi:hypothetical protein
MSLLLIVMSFILMTLGSSKESNSLSFLSLTVSPILLLAGYSMIIFAIMKRPF